MADVINQGDIALFNTITAGDILIADGQPKMEQGLETSAFITLFSGLKKEFWANALFEDKPSFQCGGEFEDLLKGMVLTVQNALRAEEAAKRDLQWMIDEKIAKTIQAESQIKNNTYFLFIAIVKPDGSTLNLQYSNNWQGQFISPSHEKVI